VVYPSNVLAITVNSRTRPPSASNLDPIRPSQAHRCGIVAGQREFMKSRFHPAISCLLLLLPQPLRGRGRSASFLTHPQVSPPPSSFQRLQPTTAPGSPKVITTGSSSWSRETTYNGGATGAWSTEPGRSKRRKAAACDHQGCWLGNRQGMGYQSTGQRVENAIRWGTSINTAFDGVRGLPNHNFNGREGHDAAMPLH